MLTRQVPLGRVFRPLMADRLACATPQGRSSTAAHRRPTRRPLSKGSPRELRAPRPPRMSSPAPTATPAHSLTPLATRAFSTPLNSPAARAPRLLGDLRHVKVLRVASLSKAQLRLSARGPRSPAVRGTRAQTSAPRLHSSRRSTQGTRLIRTMMALRVLGRLKISLLRLLRAKVLVFLAGAVDLAVGATSPAWVRKRACLASGVRQLGVSGNL
jgi:hypothetical protein